MQILDQFPLLNPPSTRGELNNNPCNLDRGTPPTPWVGLANSALQKRDARFAVFIGPEYGIRAAAIDLRTHAKRTTPFTLARLVSIWAPPNENDTRSYISNLVTWTGMAATTVVDTYNLPVMAKIITAIIHQENGRCIYPAELIQHGLMLAGDWTTPPETVQV